MLITKKKHLSLIEREKKEQERLRQVIMSDKVKHRQEERDLKNNLEEVVNNLSQISLVPDYHEGRNRWRIVLDLDPQMMSLALERGNDEHMISYIGDTIKHKVEEKIMSCNIQRPEDLNLGRPKITFV